MSPSPSTFRALIIASLALATAAIVIDMTFPYLIPTEIRLSDQRFFDAMTPSFKTFLLFSALLMAIAVFVAFVGLYFFEGGHAHSTLLWQSRRHYFGRF